MMKNGFGSIKVYCGFSLSLSLTFNLFGGLSPSLDLFTLGDMI